MSCYESYYRRASRWVYNVSGASNSSTAARDYEGVEVEAASFVCFLDAHCLHQVSLSSLGEAIHRTFSVVYAAMAHGECDPAAAAPDACASPKACGFHGFFIGLLNVSYHQQLRVLVMAGDTAQIFVILLSSDRISRLPWLPLDLFKLVVGFLSAEHDAILRVLGPGRCLST